MTYAIQELVIRDVAPLGTDEITDLVAAAMCDGPVARWFPVTSMVPSPFRVDYERRPEKAAGPGLDRASEPNANDPRNRDLCQGHGYVCQTELRLPDGPPIWTMWRSPMP